MSVIALEQVCKVRNDAVGRPGKGYSLAVFKKANKNSARVALIGPSFVPDTRLQTVQLDTLWKIKASQRKALERKVIKASAPPVDPVETPPETQVETQIEEPPPLFGQITDQPVNVFGIQSTFQIVLGRCDATLHIAFDSVLKFQGDAIVNAANTGCLGGGGIDGMVNDLGGIELFHARKALPVIADDQGYQMRCETGDAKITTAGQLPCSKVIHAVGPRFSFEGHEENLIKLEMAYKSAMDRARENELTSIGFCIISGGIYRGSCCLTTIVKTALESIAKYAYEGLKTVVFCGFTGEERQVIWELVDSMRATA